MTVLYTIGYATKPIDVFIKQLKALKINAVADVRSVPYSKVFHDYHKEAIAETLAQHMIRYVYLGEELGPRSKEESHYDTCGQVQFDRLMQSDLFLRGIERLRNGIEKGWKIALMCAEKDAATCHRSLLIGYFLQHDATLKSRIDIECLHITHHGDLEKQDELEIRLVELHGYGDDLFMSKNDMRKQAYNKQLQQTSYRKSTKP